VSQLLQASWLPRGARMVRVHDVRETVQALKLQAAVAEAAGVSGRPAS